MPILARNGLLIADSGYKLQSIRTFDVCAKGQCDLTLLLLEQRFMFGFQNLAVMITLLVTGPFIIILLVVIIVFARSARKASASKRWPAANGRILSSDVTSHRSLDSNGTHTTIYEPQVVYEYAANGQTYRSKEISFGAISGMSGSGWAEGIAGKYPMGSAVQVFYNPGNPSQAVLE